MPRYANALWMPNNNAFTGRDGQRPRYVMIHGTAGGSSAQNIAIYFKGTEGTANSVSANYIDGQDGTIVCCNDESDGAWANGFLSAGHDTFWDTGINPNNLTISIEVVKADLNNATAPTDAQMSSLVKLVDDICNRWNIPKRWADAAGGITGHFSVDPVNRQNCPGNFPWDTFFSSLQGDDPVLQDKLTTLQNAYNDVVAKKNALVAEKNDLEQQLAKTQADLQTLRDAWNKVVPQKNALIAQTNDLQNQIAQLKQQLATATSNVNVTLLQTQIQTLQAKLSQIYNLVKPS